MSEWQDISTAPTGQMVRLGRWNSTYVGGSGYKLIWQEDAGIAWESCRDWLGRRSRKPAWEGRNYQYWAPLPPPPPRANVDEVQG